MLRRRQTHQFGAGNALQLSRTGRMIAMSMGGQYVLKLAVADGLQKTPQLVAVTGTGINQAKPRFTNQITVSTRPRHRPRVTPQNPKHRHLAL